MNATESLQATLLAIRKVAYFSGIEDEADSVLLIARTKHESETIFEELENWMEEYGNETELNVAFVAEHGRAIQVHLHRSKGEISLPGIVAVAPNEVRPDSVRSLIESDFSPAHPTLLVVSYLATEQTSGEVGQESDMMIGYWIYSLSFRHS